MSYPPRRPTTKDKDRISLSASKDRGTVVPTMDDSSLPLTPASAGYYFSNLKPRTIHEAGRNITIKDMNWSPPGTRIACALSDKVVRVWNPDKPEVRNSTELKGHTMPPCAVVWNPTHSDLLASCSPDGTVKFWDYRIKACLGTVTTGGENIALAWHPSGETVVVATRVCWIGSYITTREDRADKGNRMISFTLLLLRQRRLRIRIRYLLRFTRLCFRIMERRYFCLQLRGLCCSIPSRI
jgi:WD40 repeat protein